MHRGLAARGSPSPKQPRAAPAERPAFRARPREEPGHPEAAGPLLADAESPEEAQLRLELEDALAQVSQLRAAVSATAAALHGVASRLPPDLRRRTQPQDHLLDDLRRQLWERDEELIRLQRDAGVVKTAAHNSRRTIVSAMQRWAPESGGHHLLRDLFGLWRRDAAAGARERAQERRLQDSEREAKQKQAAKLGKAIGCLVHDGKAQARIVLRAWKAQSEETVRSLQDDRVRRAKVEKVMKFWHGDMSRSAKVACFHAWQRLLEIKNARLKEEEVFKRQAKEAEQVKKELQKSWAMGRAALVLRPADGETVKQIVFKGWLESLLETRATKVVAEMREHQQRFRDRQRDRVLLTLKGDSKTFKAATFRAWKDELVEAKWKTKQTALDNDACLRRNFYTWQRVVRHSMHEGKLEKVKREQERMEAETRSLLQKKQGILAMVSGRSARKQNPSGLEARALVSLAWSALLENVRLNEKEKWSDVFREEEERRKKMQLDMSGKLVMFGDKALLKAAWSWWRELISRRERDRRLSGRQLLYEREQRGEQRDMVDALDGTDMLQMRREVLEDAMQDEAAEEQAAPSGTSAQPAAAPVQPPAPAAKPRSGWCGCCGRRRHAGRVEDGQLDP